MISTEFEKCPLALKLVTAGTAACVADIVTFPLDTAKVRLQIQGESTTGLKSIFRYRGVLHTVMTIAKQEGIRGLYSGLSAGLQRQMCFASVRIGLYEPVKNFYQETLRGDKKANNFLDLLIRMCAGMTTGALSVLLAQPTDVVKVRFQATQNQKTRYRSTSEAYKTIYQTEGVRGLWKGMFPNIARNAIVNVSEIVCYDTVKTAILKNHLMGDDVYCHFTSAVAAGFLTTVASSPVDVIKTRYMNSRPGRYRSAMHCILETVKNEGFSALYKGFTPSFHRLVTWNIVLWVTYEKLKFIAVYISKR